MPVSAEDLEALRAIVARNPELTAIAAVAAPPAPAEPPKKKRKPRKQQQMPEILTDQELSRLWHVITKPRDRALFVVAYHRGLRVSEMAMIDVQDYDRQAGKLVFQRLKGSRGGIYSLTHFEKVALNAWLRVRGNKPGPLFLSRQGDGRGVGRKQLHALMRQYCAAAGIAKKKAHFHTLKHSVATYLSAHDPDIVSIQDHLGHACITNTMKYVQVSSKRRETFTQGLERSGFGAVKR